MLMCCFESGVSMWCQREFFSAFWVFESMFRMQTPSRSHSLSQSFSDVLKAFLEMLKEVEAEILTSRAEKGHNLSLNVIYSQDITSLGEK